MIVCVFVSPFEEVSTMNRYATFLAAVTLATGFAALRTTDESSHETVDLQEALAAGEKVKDLLTQYRAFKGTFETTIESLRHGQIRLKEARVIVRETAERHYPKYLKMLTLSEKGAKVDERVARNLVGHVHTIESYHPTQPSPLAKLDQELRDLLTELAE
jgi:hypothetical protein